MNDVNHDKTKKEEDIMKTIFSLKIILYQRFNLLFIKRKRLSFVA